MPMWGGGFSGNVSVSSPSIATYRVDLGALAYTIGGAQNVFLQIIGSATKTVKIVQYFIWKPSTNINFTVIKQSTLTTGGTSTTPLPIPLDSGDTAATAVVKLYSTSVGSVAGTPVGTTLLTLNLTPGDSFGDEPGDNNGSNFVLRAATESFVFTADASATLRGFIEWTES